ncbi:MAG: DUF4258 domain-containing protein [Alphaproteobacteria bacterium]
MPPDLTALRQCFAERTYLLTAHASDRAAQRGIISREIEEAVADGEIIEDYPDDKYGPSCLLLGYTKAGRALHVQVSYPPAVKVITVYEPLPDQWDESFRVRKPK